MPADMRMRLRAAALVALVALACGARRTPPALAPTSAVAAEATPYVFAEAPALSRYELAFDLPDRTLHPDDVVIEARFTSPSGKTMTVGGFPSHGRFVVRFTPREEGPHAFVIHANDIVQWHLYGSGFYDPYAVALEMARKVEESSGFEKPILCGEFAYGGEHKPAYDHTHNGIWSLLLSGAGALAHSAPQFQVDSDEPMTPERAAHFRVLSDFLSSFDPSQPLQPANDVQPSDAEARVLSLTSSAGARAIWILGPRKTYGSPVKALRLKLPAPPKGTWIVTWIDDVTGKQVGRRALDSTGKGEITLDVPTFVRHVAARVLPR